MEKLLSAYQISLFLKAESKSKIRFFFLSIQVKFLAFVMRIANLLIYKIDTKDHLKNLNQYFDHLLVNDKKSIASYFAPIIENKDQIKIDTLDKHSNVLFVFHGTHLLQNLGAILFKLKESLLTDKPLHILIYRRIKMPEFERWWADYAKFVGIRLEFHHYDSATYMLKANRVLKAGGVLMVAPDFFLGDYTFDDYEEEIADSYIRLMLRVAARNKSAVNVLNTLEPVGSSKMPFITPIDMSDEAAAAKQVHKEYMDYINASWEGWFFSLRHMESIKKNARPQSD